MKVRQSVLSLHFLLKRYFIFSHVTLESEMLMKEREIQYT